MSNLLSNQMIINRSMRRFWPQGDESNESSKFENSQLQVLRSTSTKRVGLKMDNFAQGLRVHVRLAPKLTETMKGKMSLGVKILKHLFGIRNGEKLLKASQCYLSTTSGPIAGLLFISNFKISFFSERSIKIVSPTGKFLKVHYKVSIPSVNIREAFACEDVKRSSQKYIKIVTEDNFVFWLMRGF